jgi:hypothetical protein
MTGEARIVEKKMSPEEVKGIAIDTFGDMVKLVIDVSRDKLAIGGALHADGEELLLQDGSSQVQIWGANYFPGKSPGSKLEYTALINIRPSQDNNDQYIQSEELRNKVKEIVERWIGPA